ncbi:hypothetical protein EW145_g3680 [Phellinidium pouzarii]|uniref:Uncharacterized protein n=1 Tax=Phellinidium pouzarii TaxID=167371 RepID=A0A4S4L6I1_9AGAM|nr:hypothetical protein EW145_g3680 [Phellinidium pouzarii]
MSFKKLLFASALLVGSAFVTVNADLETNSWYALFTDDNQFLDSEKGVVVVTNVDGGVSKISSTDKGQRFRFPSGLNGKVICQSHENHYLGYSQKEQFRVDMNDSDSVDVTVVASSDNNMLSFNFDQYFLSSSGQGKR